MLLRIHSISVNKEELSTFNEVDSNSLSDYVEQSENGKPHITSLKSNSVGWFFKTRVRSVTLDQVLQIYRNAKGDDAVSPTSDPAQPDFKSTEIEEFKQHSTEPRKRSQTAVFNIFPKDDSSLNPFKK